MPLRQSLSWWCYANRGVSNESLLREAAKIGYEGVELIGEDLWSLARDCGLSIASVGGHGTIEDGLNRRENASRILDELNVSIGKAVEWKIPVLICFSGNRAGLDDNAGRDICAETLAGIAPVAEKAGVLLAVELLNSNVDHNDYQCDHTAWGIELCKQVNSPAVRLLYDIYHMQVMEGDIIRSIRESHQWFGHYHTAGNPGRNDPDDTQEINYRPIYREIVATGYTGMIGHEFVPKAEPVAALKAAFEECVAATESAGK